MSEQKRINVKVEYGLGESVWFLCDPEGFERMITGYVIRNGIVTYITAFAGGEQYAFDFELTNERPII